MNPKGRWVLLDGIERWGVRITAIDDSLNRPSDIETKSFQHQLSYAALAKSTLAGCQSCELLRYAIADAHISSNQLTWRRV